MTVEPIHVISLGAGVQSSAMALMAACGDITPMPVMAIFADTQDEPPEVYRWLEYLKPKLPFPIVTVTAGRLSQTFGDAFVHIPAFRRNKNGTVTMGKKQCTRHFKLKPIYEYLRQCGAHHKKPMTIWIGISVDEISRVKPARVKFVVNRWPLAMELSMTRFDCLKWLKSHGHPEPPKSACEFCPLKSMNSWRKTSPQSMRRAIKVDDFLRKTRGEYLHQSCTPLRDIDFSTEEERGQLNMFNNECEGMCGV